MCEEGGDILDRKTRLLAEPLLSRDGYLIGYLAVKSFSTWAALVTDEFEDSDFALSYSVHHFFYDYDLVNLLLDRSPFDGRYVNSVTEHLAERLDHLFARETLRSAADRYEAELLGDQKGMQFLDSLVLPAEPIGNKADDTERARRALVDTLSGLSDDAETQVARHSLLHLTSIPVDIEFDDENYLASYEGRALLRGRLSPAMPSGTQARGSVDVFYEVTTSVQGLAVSIDGRVFTKTVSDRSDELLPWLDQFIVARQHVIDVADMLSQRLRSAIDQSQWADLRNELVRSSRSRREEIYQHYAFLWLDPERRPAFVRAARDEGFAAIVGRRLTRSLALLGLLDALGAYLEEVDFVQELASAVKADCQEIVTKLEAAFDGVPFLFEPIEEEGERRTRVRAFV